MKKETAEYINEITEFLVMFAIAMGYRRRIEGKSKRKGVSKMGGEALGVKA